LYNKNLYNHKLFTKKTFTKKLLLLSVISMLAMGQTLSANTSHSSEQSCFDAKSAVAELPFSHQSTNPSDLTTHIESDKAVATNKNSIEFEGDVVITRNNQRLSADIANYNKTDEIFSAQGNVEISQPGVIFTGEDASYLLESMQGKLTNSSYKLPARPAQGKSETIEFKPGLIQMRQPTFSTCPADAQDWVIKASKMNLNTEDGYADGKHVLLYFKGVPLFYTPYIQFPLNDKRKSGFLLPELAFSSQNGADLSAPYYWNIAPNMDATIKPRFLSKRGLMLGTQFRFLDENQSAELYVEYLNDSHPNEDRAVAEVLIRGEDVSENRGAVSFQHHSRISPRWNSFINFNYVSDNYYIDDFGNNLKDRSESHLLREGVISYANSFLNFTTRLQGYQEIKEDMNTYSRLPQLSLNTYKKISNIGLPLGLGFTSEAVYFKKNWDYEKEIDEGQRYSLHPYLEMPYSRQYGFIKPKIGFDILQYNLDETSVSSSADTDFTRTIPIFSIDSGLFFEKEINIFDSEMVQTLEPRLFYLYVPDEEQNLYPLFDTSLNHFSFSQLFRENRFSGKDRLGDANQLSYALTSRFIDDTNGVERLRASIGQILYFEDREVQLTASTATEKLSTSAVATEISSYFLPHWNSSLAMMYDTHQSEFNSSMFRLQYKSDPYHIVNFDYTYKNDGTESENYEQIDMSMYWKIAPHWRTLARYNYSIQDNFNLESMLGLEYNSCCYAFRLVASQEQAYETEDADIRIMLQMQFKGLGSVGNISDRTLSNDIPGFETIMDR
jgi:LPS-assembly protein